MLITTAGWVDLLERYEWDVFVTLTFRQDDMPVRAASQCFQDFCSDLARILGRHVRVGFSCGPQEKRGQRFLATPHFHAVLGRVDGGEPIKRTLVVEIWRHGNAQARPFDPTRGHGDSTRGGLAYMSRHAYVDVAVACPDRRHWKHRPCRVAGVAWPGHDALSEAYVRLVAARRLRSE